MQGDDNKDPLLSNKIAGAILAALLLVFGLPQLTAALMGTGGHHGGEAEELHLAYCCVDLETEAAAPGEDAEADLGSLLADASAAAGERRAALCKSCHTFGQGEPNSTGPNLWNVVGSPVANNSGFNYTSALENFGGEWTYERLDAFIHNSQEFVPGTAMVQRFANAKQRADILAYLQTLSDDPVPFPEPAAPEASAETAEETAPDASEGTAAGKNDDDPAAAEAAEDQAGDGEDVVESTEEIEEEGEGAAADTPEPQGNDAEDSAETGEPE